MQKSKPKKILLLLLLLIFVLVFSFVFLVPHSSKQQNHRLTKTPLTTTKDVSNKSSFHLTKDQLAENYNQFCFKNGIVLNDSPLFDKDFDLDKNQIDCDEKEETTKKVSKNTTTKLLALYDKNSNDSKKLIDNVSNTVDVKDVIDQDVKGTVKPLDVNEDVRLPSVLKSVQVLSIPQQVLLQQPTLPIQLPQQIKQTNLTKKQIQENKDNEDVKYIIDKINEHLKSTSTYKTSLDFKNILTDVVPNVNIKINELVEPKNNNLLDKLTNEKIQISINGKNKEISIKDLLIKHILKPMFNGIELTPEQKQLYDKYNESTDLNIKSNCVKKLLDFGIDINNIKEV